MSRRCVSIHWINEVTITEVFSAVDLLLASRLRPLIVLPLFSMLVKFIQSNIITNNSSITVCGLRNRQPRYFRIIYFKDNPGEEEEGLLLCC